MTHLGRWLSALVDSELDDMERDRVLNHVAGCDACRHEVSAMRALKRRLTALGETCAETAIAGRLIELANAGPDLRVGRPLDRATWAPVDELGPFTRQRARVNRAGLKMATASAASALIAIALAAFLLGSGPDGPPAPRITPSVDSYLLQHTRDAGQAPAGAVIGQHISRRPGYERYKASPASSADPVRLDPLGGTGRIAQVAAPAGTGSSPGPVVSVSVARHHSN